MSNDILYELSGLKVDDRVKICHKETNDEFNGIVIHIEYYTISYLNKHLTEYIFVSVDKNILSRGSSIYTLRGHCIIDTFIDIDKDIIIFHQNDSFVLNPHKFTIKVDDIIGVLIWRVGYDISIN